MPTSFPDLESRIFVAEVWKFRPPQRGRERSAYRAALVGPSVSR
jgi:hypothetical protein